MKKGLRNTIAMGVLTLTNLFGEIRSANAGWIDSEKKAQEAAEQLFPDIQFKSIVWTEKSIEELKALAAVEVVKAKEMLPSLLKFLSEKNGINFSKEKEITLIENIYEPWDDYGNYWDIKCTQKSGRTYPDGRFGSFLTEWPKAPLEVKYVINPQKGTFRWNVRSENGKFMLSSPKEIEMGKGKDFKTLTEERLQEILNDNKFYGFDEKAKKAVNLSDFIQKFCKENELSLDSGIVTFLTRDGEIKGFLFQPEAGEEKRGFELRSGMQIMRNYPLTVEHTELVDRDGNGRDYSGAITINLDNRTYKLAGDATVQFGHVGIESPELSFAPERVKTKTRAVSPSVRKVVSEQLQNN